MCLAVVSNMHFKGKPETPGPLALFPLTARASPSAQEWWGEGVCVTPLGWAE